MTPISVIAFPGAPNLPVFAAEQEGWFAEEGLELRLEFTPSSVYQAETVAAGRADMAFTAFDNVVAYAEGQGAAGEGVDPDYVVVMGATQLDVALMAAADIAEPAALAGRRLALDAPTTGFAFVAYEILRRAGLSRDDVEMEAVGATPQRWQALKGGATDATLTIEPFTSLAGAAGFRPLGSTMGLFDAYQGGIVAARRGFARDHPDRVRGLLRAMLRGLAWVRDPANREAATALLRARMSQIQDRAVEPVMRSLLDPRSGLTPDGALLPDGMRTVMELRERFGGGGPLDAPERYVDLSHWHAVRA